MDSKNLTDTQTRYSSIHGEFTTMVWVILKCTYWLKGCLRFTVYSDHQALSNIYFGNQELAEFPEELKNLREATL